MRPLAALCIWILLAGGLSWYMHREQSPVAQHQIEALNAAREVYDLELTPTFAAVDDPFALQLDEAEAPAVLKVSLNGKALYQATEIKEAGVPIQVKKIQGLHEGKNEFYLESSPPLGDGRQAHALRIRVFRDGQPVLEKSLWSEGGAQVADTFLLEIAPQQGETSHDQH